jgi:hypothetical protein
VTSQHRSCAPTSHPGGASDPFVNLISGGRRFPKRPYARTLAATSHPSPRHRSAHFTCSIFNCNHHHLLLMLRLGLFAYTNPLFRPVASRSGPRILPLRPFGSTARPWVLEVLRARPTNFISKPFQQTSRSIVDSAVVSRPSQAEAWRRYAVTAVRLPGTTRVLVCPSHYSLIRRPQLQAPSSV